MDVVEKTNVTRDGKGRVTHAEVVGPDGATIGLTIEKGVSKPTKGGKASFGTIKITHANKPLLQVTCTISATSVGLKAEGEGVAADWAIDLSDYQKTQHGVISGKIGTRALTGTFDPRPGRAQSDLGLSDWVPADAEKKIAALRPVLENLAQELHAGVAEHKPAIDHYMTRGAWQTIGHAACWGFGGMGAAAACVATAGVGCPLGAAAFGAAAAACSDQYDN